MDDHESVVIFGGPMSANDSETLPFIRTELDWIPTAIASGKPCLGICLGAQLLARTLGAKVAPHPAGKAEIGYFPVMPKADQEHFSRPLNFYHWNQEGFELPRDAVLLATGATFPNQAQRAVVAINKEPQRHPMTYRSHTSALFLGSSALRI